MKFYYTILLSFILGMMNPADAAANPKISAIVTQIQSAGKNPKVCAQHCTPAKCYQDAIADACIANCPSRDKKSCTFVKTLKMRMLKYKAMHASQGATPASPGSVSGPIANDTSGASSPTIPVKTGAAGNVRVCISIHPQGAQEGGISGGSKKQIKQQAKQEKKQIAAQEKTAKHDLKQQAKQEKKAAKK